MFARKAPVHYLVSILAVPKIMFLRALYSEGKVKTIPIDTQTNTGNLYGKPGIVGIVYSQT